MKRIVETLDEVHWVFMDAQGISWPITRESKSYVGLDADGNICGEVDITAKLEGDNIAACRGCAMGDLHCLIVRLGEGYRIAAYHPDSTAEKAFLFPQEQFVAPVSLTGFGGFLYVVDSMGFLHIVDVRKGVDRSSLVKCLPVEQGVVRLAATSRGVFVASTSWVGKMSHEGQWMYRYPLKALGESAGSIEMMQFSLCVGSEYKLYISERRSKELLSFVV